MWHISEDNYASARAAIVDAHHRHPLAAIWSDGSDSSDGQYFRAGGRAGPGGAVNAKYGIDPGVVLYTAHSGQYGPMHTRVISATASEAPYVLDGLHPHAHRTSLRIVEHYTDTAGATDHVFGLCHLLGYRFAPCIKDLKERKLYAIEKPDTYPLLKPLIGDAVDTAALVRGWAELMRVKASIEAGVVAPSTILRSSTGTRPISTVPSNTCAPRVSLSPTNCSPTSRRSAGSTSRSRASTIGTRGSRPTACGRSGRFPPRSCPAPLSVQFDS